MVFDHVHLIQTGNTDCKNKNALDLPLVQILCRIVFPHSECIFIESLTDLLLTTMNSQITVKLSSIATFN